jgi:CcmD family protein
MLMDTIKNVAPALIALLVVGVASPLLGQESFPSSGMGAQSLRAYWHVFIAYTIAIVMVLGWVVSIGRRLKDVEERLGD